MKDILRIVEAVEREGKFLISTHLNPDGDAIGSELALFHLLSNLGKEVQVINNESVPKIFQFLPGSSHIKTTEHLKPPYDCTFILDCGQDNRTGRIMLKNKKDFGLVVNIDHHATNFPWGDLNWIDQKASSTAEMIYSLIVRLIREPDLDMACCVYCGLMTDTGSFRYSNTSSETLSLATELVKMGVNPSYIANQVYDTIPLNTLKLLGLGLSDIGITEDGLVAWMAIPQSHLDATDTDWGATEEFINYPRSIPSVKIALLFKEVSLQEIKVSYRSKGRVNVAQIAQVHGGGGHLNAAGCTVQGTLASVMEKIIMEARRELSEKHGSDQEIRQNKEDGKCM